LAVDLGTTNLRLQAAHLDLDGRSVAQEFEPCIGQAPEDLDAQGGPNTARCCSNPQCLQVGWPRNKKKRIEAARHQLKSTTTPDTEIMAALDFADRTFAAAPRARHLLLLFIDMQEQSSSLDAGNAKEALSDDRIRQILADERTNGSLPALRGATVIVVGAKSTDSSSYRRIRRFWSEQFAAANGQLKIENYGGVLNVRP
jgi:hypothetical protein